MADLSGEKNFAHTLRELELTVTRRLDGLLRGNFLSNAVGVGSEFGTAREYEIGDDVRRMDWSVTARTNTPHVRDTVAERELEVQIIVDTGARFGTGQAAVTKADLATAACAAVAYLSDVPGTGNRVGLITGSTVVPLGSGRNHIRRLIAAQAATSGESDLSVPITRLARTAHRTGMTVVISDFLGDITWVDALNTLHQRCDVLAIELIDPADEQLPGDGPVRLQDPATGEVVDIIVTDEARANYAQTAARHRADVHSALRAAGARVVTLRTDRDWVVDFAHQIARNSIRQ